MTHGPVAVIPAFAAAAITLLLAGIVLWKGIGRRTHQVLGYLLLLLGAVGVGQAMQSWHLSGVAVSETTPQAELWRHFSVYWYAPAATMMVLFALVTSPRADRLPRLATHPLVWLVLAALFPVLYGVDRSLFVGDGGTASSGPLGLVTAALYLAAMLVAWVFFRRAARAPTPQQRDQHLLLGTGLILPDVVFGVWMVSLWLRAPRLYFLTGMDVVAAAIYGLAWASVIAFAGLVVARAWRERRGGPAGHRRAAALLVASFVGALAVVGLGAVERAYGWHELNTVTMLVRFLFSTALSAAVLAYVLLRAGVPGIDVRIRSGIRGGTIASAFVAVFFVASEGAQQLFAASTGPWIGLVAAGALVFVMSPLQRVAERVADAAVPPPSPAPAAPASASKEDAYRHALRLAMRDRRLTREEELHLMHLADELGLTARRALELRHEAERNAEAPGSPGAAQ